MVNPPNPSEGSGPVEKLPIESANGTSQEAPVFDVRMIPLPGETFIETLENFERTKEDAVDGKHFIQLHQEFVFSSKILP